MKKIKYLLIFVGFIQNNCGDNKSQNQDNSVINVKLPIGDLKAISYNFPKNWVEETYTTNNIPINENIKNFQSLWDFNYTFYESLDTNRLSRRIISVDYFERRKILFQPPDLRYNRLGSIFIDSVSYYCGTLFRNKDYCIVLYKDRGLHDDNIGDGICIANYVNLVCLDKNNQVSDHLTIYLYSRCLYSWTRRFFYIDKELNIIIKDFDGEEAEPIKNLGTSKYKFDYKGKFIKIE